MTPPCSFHGQRTDGRKDGEPAGPCFGSRGCSGRASAPAAFRLQASAAALAAKTPPDPARTYSPRCQRKAWEGRGDRAAGAGDPGAPAAPLGGAAPALLLSFSPPFPPPFPPPRPPPSPSSPPRESGSCTVHGGLGAWVLVPSGVTSPGDAAGAAAGAGSAPPHSLPHLAPKPCVCGGSAGAPEPSAGCKEGEPGAGPGAVRLKINTDSADPSIRKLDLSGTLLRTLLVQPSL